MVTLTWDETGQKLKFSPMATGGTTQSATWEALVSRFRFAWGWKGRIYHYDAVLAPVPLRSNASSHIKSGLFQHPANKDVMEFAAVLLECARIPLCFHCSDGHFANIKLHNALAKEAARFGRHVLHGLLRCGNHCNNLVSVSVVSSLSMDTLNDLYATTLFLKMGCHFLMLQSAVGRVTKTACRRLPSVAPQAVAAAEKYNNELKDYFLATFRFNPGEIKDLGPYKHKKSKFGDLLESCFKLFNGPAWEHESGELVHYCMGCHRDITGTMCDILCDTICGTSRPCNMPGRCCNTLCDTTGSACDTICDITGPPLRHDLRHRRFPLRHKLRHHRCPFAS